MPIIFINDENKVKTVHYKPEKLNQDRLDKGYEVDEIPEKPSTERGEKAVAYYDKDKEEVYYEIEEKSLTLRERVSKLEERIEKLES